MKIFKVTLALLLLSVMIVGCNSHAPELNVGLLTGKPCAPPCWQNLTPGTSTNEDVEQFLKNLNPIEWPERDDRVSTMGCTVISVRDQPGIEVNRLVNLFVYEERLMWIQSDINQTMTLKMIVDNYGEPTYYRATNAIGLDGSAYYSVSVYYPSIGLKLDIAVDEKLIGRILPNMKVLAVEYYPVGDIEGYFSNKYTCWIESQEMADAINDELRYTQPWTGFGDIQVIETR